METGSLGELVIWVGHTSQAALARTRQLLCIYTWSWVQSDTLGDWVLPQLAVRGLRYEREIGI